MYTHTQHAHTYTHIHTADPRDIRGEWWRDHQLPSLWFQLGQGCPEGSKAMHRWSQSSFQRDCRRFGKFSLITSTQINVHCVCVYYMYKYMYVYMFEYQGDYVAVLASGMHLQSGVFFVSKQQVE